MVNKVKKIILCVGIFCILALSFVLYLVIEKENGIKKVNIEEESLIPKIETIYVYFPRLPDMEFVGETLEIENNLPCEEKVRRIIKKIMDGPEDNNLISVFPDGATLNKVKVNNNIAYLDFSIEFIENHPGGSIGEYNTLYSIVNSLTEIEEIEAVDFSIDGEKFKTYKGHCEFNEPLSKFVH